MTDTHLPIGSIRVGTRVRKDMGDLQGLADSINEVGLLQPVVVNEGHELIAGHRRLEAVRLLGWSEVPVRVTGPLDTLQTLEAERDENTQREDWSVSEAVAFGMLLEPVAQEAAAERRREGGQRGGRSSGSQEPLLPHRSREDVAALLDMGGTTYTRAKRVVLTAADDSMPDEVREAAQEALKEMDGSGSVRAAEEKVKAAIDRAGLGPRPKSGAANGNPKDRHEVHRKSRRPRPGPMMEQLIDILDGIRLSIPDFDFTELDPDRLSGWSADLDQSLKPINALNRKIQRHVKDQNRQTVEAPVDTSG